jgi:DNA modification methylase
MTNLIVFGDSQNMSELPDKSVQLIATSCPYYNAPFDTPGLFHDYDQFLSMMGNIAKETKRVLDDGRIVALVVDDVTVDGQLFPIVADMTHLFRREGFKYRAKIIWKKPNGYCRISRRSGVLVQHPYPMYGRFDNLTETILLMQNGEFAYEKIPQEVRDSSKIDLVKWLKEAWHLGVWEITNVLPTKDRLETGIAAFPAEIPRRLIELFSYRGETILDPFMGSGTTLKVARELGRNAVGYEIDVELLETVRRKLSINQTSLSAGKNGFDITIRNDAKRLRTQLQRRVKENKSHVGH